MSCWSELSSLPSSPPAVVIIKQVLDANPGLDKNQIGGRVAETVLENNKANQELLKKYIAEDNLECFCYLVATREYYDRRFDVKFDYKTKIGRLMLSIPSSCRDHMCTYDMCGNDIVLAEYAGLHDMVDHLIAKDKEYIHGAARGAIYANNLERVKKLITEPIDCIVVEAARLGRTEILAYLLSIGCDAEDDWDHEFGPSTALNYAVLNGHYDCAVMLRERLNDEQLTLDVVRIIDRISPSQYEFYINIGLDVNNAHKHCDESLFMHACGDECHRTNERVLRYMIKNKQFTEQDIKTLSESSCLDSATKIVRKILIEERNPDYQNMIEMLNK